MEHMASHLAYYSLLTNTAIHRVTLLHNLAFFQGLFLLPQDSFAILNNFTCGNSAAECEIKKITQN